MNKRILIVLAAVLAVTAVAACSSKTPSTVLDRTAISTNSSTPYYSGTPPMTTSSFDSSKGETAPTITLAPVPTIIVTAPAETVTTTDGSGTVYAGISDTSTVPDQRMIVRTGNMSIVVNDIAGALNDISTIATNLQGYVVSSNSWQDGESLYGSISIRIPVDSYDGATGSITQMAVDVTSQSTSSQDVTEQYVDLGAQLSNLQATEQQLLAIMAKAVTVEDILSVQTQLSSVEGQIEQIEGTMQYLEKTSATSLINISLSQAKLDAQFSASTVNAKTGENIQFNPDVAGGFTPYSYAWDFGDGGTSTDSNPVHSYARAGKYTITLKVTDDKANTVTTARDAYVTITKGGWSAGGVVSGAWGGMLWLGGGIVSAVIGLAIFSPVWIILGVAVWFVIWRRKKAKVN